MNNKNVSYQSNKLLDKLRETDQLCFTINEAYRLLPDSKTHTVKRLLSDMTRRGLFMRVKEGVYYVIPFEQDPGSFMPDWHLLSQHLIGEAEGYIGYFSALHIHGLTTQPILREQIVVNKQVKPSVLYVKNIPFQFIFHNETHFFGHKKTWIDGFNRVSCSDLEKTIVDCLFKPQYGGGITEIAKAIHKSRDKIDFPKLLESAVRFNSQAVIKRLGFLLEFFEIDTPIIEELQGLRTNSFITLEPSYPKKGKTIYRWAIQQNIDSQSILSPICS